MHPEMVAAYIAKYATKAAEDFGLEQRPPERELHAAFGVVVVGAVQDPRKLSYDDGTHTNPTCEVPAGAAHGCANLPGGYESGLATR
jgi:hypothetical protein